MFKTSQRSSAHIDEEAAKRDAENDQLHTEIRKANELAKEEEEKRVKAISLLKTVRQKLVKAEKDKEDAVKELNTNRGREQGERERERGERMRLQQEVGAVSEEREKAVVGLKVQFDKEVTNLKEGYERELAALEGQFELDAVTMKVRAFKSLLSLSLTRVAECIQQGIIQQEFASSVSRKLCQFSVGGEEFDLRSASTASSRA